MSQFLKTLLAAGGGLRAVISERPDGILHVGFEKWDDSAVGGIGGYNDPFWRPDGEGIVVANLVEAEAAAMQRLGPGAHEG